MTASYTFCVVTFTGDEKNSPYSEESLSSSFCIISYLPSAFNSSSSLSALSRVFLMLFIRFDIVSRVILTFVSVLSAPLIIVLTDVRLSDALISELYIELIDVLNRFPAWFTEPLTLVFNILLSELMLVWHWASTLSRYISKSCGLVSDCIYQFVNVSRVCVAPFISSGIRLSELIRLSYKAWL